MRGSKLATLRESGTVIRVSGSQLTHKLAGSKNPERTFRADSAPKPSPTQLGFTVEGDTLIQVP